MPTKKPSSTILIAAAIIVLAIIVANAVRNAPEEAPAPEDGLSTEVVETHVEDNEEPAASRMPAGYVLPEEFEDRERAEAIINRTQGKEPGVQGGERIVFGIVEDEAEAGTVYFATTSIDLENNFVGVYQYEIENGRWHRLTKATFAAEDGRTPPTLHVVGKIGDELLVLKDEKTRNAGPCDSMLLLGEKEGFTLYSLDTQEPLDGLRRYELPSAVRNAEETKVENCES